MSVQNLKDKTVKGVVWSGVDNVAQFGVSFIVSIILARLLTPDDYGLLGIVNIFTSVCTAIINGGFTNALIRKKNVTSDDFNTVFIVNLGSSLFLYVVIFLTSPLISVFFGREELALLIRISSLGMIIGSLALVQQTRLTKEIDFKTQTKITLIASLSSGVIGIIMAFRGYGVWALVVQYLSSQLIRTILLWVYNHWVPNLSFSVESFRELFGFGWKIMVSNIINTIWKELYQVVVGKFYSPAKLGQYTRAKQFSQLFSSNLTIVVQRVTFPVLSDVQDDIVKMASAYRRIIKITMFSTAICMFFLGAISEPLLYCLIGPKWHEAALYLPLICIAGSLYPLQAINLNMLQVQGRSDLYLGLEVAKKIIAIIPLIVGALVGIMPMLYVNLATSLIDFFLNSFFSGKKLGYSTWQQIIDVTPSYGIAIVVALSVWFLKFMPVSMWIILPLQIVVGITVFFVACHLTKPDEYNTTKEIVMQFFVKLKNNRKK